MISDGEIDQLATVSSVAGNVHTIDAASSDVDILDIDSVPSNDDLIDNDTSICNVNCSAGIRSCWYVLLYYLNRT